ncbi:GDSL esterase/lipase At2g19010-like [Camellia sinensis]|uniref:GDSL esterase/lipase At2g19010-like n=1 Tax=Camellia sinensis TaxID=4442 RepID=UPI001036DA76|nr:GDSL esterase/lipase At2g19010-like [Camellia sinensis]
MSSAATARSLDVSMVTTTNTLRALAATRFTGASKISQTQPGMVVVAVEDGTGLTAEADGNANTEPERDSLADNGNNNVGSSAKSNYQPYGIDFPEGPTGRFCNDRTISDIIAEHLGFDDFIPSFARALDQDILMGVNYASGGAGIHNETGRKLDLNSLKLTIQVDRAVGFNGFVFEPYFGDLNHSSFRIN